MRLFSVFAVLGFFAVSCAKDPVFDPGAGGATGSGGKTASGGASGSGGKSGSGGVKGTGGRTGSGGSSQPVTGECTDVSSYASLVTGQYGADTIDLDGNSGKNYWMIANWWGKYDGQTENINGVGFTLSNPKNVSSTSNNPIGFPTIYIGNYQGKGTKGSNLPKQLSSLTSVPTILSTNADSKGTSNYNVAYDVWLSASSGGVSGTNPGAGGAYVMVWLFMPSDRQPRGRALANGRVIQGVSGGWSVWVDTTDPSCVSYVADDNLASLEFDLNAFLKDAVANKYGNVTANQYLSIIFAGFEVWGGGDGLQIKRFCANVK
ncbi:MAG: hypothetical protein JXP73_07490 [Deltaproteobacteria bacterium]|nr:hypothetical protein [Deltaproteobacteria bacterium]